MRAYQVMQSLAFPLTKEFVSIVLRDNLLLITCLQPPTVGGTSLPPTTISWFREDFRMTRVTFGVSASSFIANMCVKQNALDHASAYPLAAEAVGDSFYVDDGLTPLRTLSNCMFNSSVRLNFCCASGIPANLKSSSTLRDLVPGCGMECEA